MPTFTLDDFIPERHFGRDHYSLLAYVESVEVDCQGFMVGFDPRMRQGRRHWRVMREKCPNPRRGSSARMNPAMVPVMDNAYSSRLRDTEMVHGHDDWHVVQDLAAAGYFTEGPNRVEPRVVLQLSEKGRRVANELRAWKAAGGNFVSFTPSHLENREEAR